MSAEFVVVVPVRYGSTRLPAKALAVIGDRPMFVHVYERARQSGAREVIVATDDDRIVAAARPYDVHVELTALSHQSGTDRIAEVAVRHGWDDDAIVVNVQGDEPLIPWQLIDQVAELLHAHPEAKLATLVTALSSSDEFENPNHVKVVTDREGYALYFSRSAIPFSREGGVPALTRRHVGIYAYRAATLRTLAGESPCELESTERLEQLRALWLGHRIIVADACVKPAIGVDTREDLEAVRAQFLSANSC